ncbi:MAG TPA: beta-ketoacyl-ACP reductase [Candidatus Jacksonbacteria bacterium]|nr:beta-ketoacyl-ACP reductase [Candidatus Jacksonbacteria bacterium]HCE49283.1 beta-ketoacyl-ACP reductase [Candidatus Jacksonbacteria bacterium]
MAIVIYLELEILNLEFMFGSKKQVALVTGASRGIGRACALELARLGARVVVNYRQSEEQAYGVVEEIKKMGSEAVAIQADVAQKTECQKLVTEAIKQYQKIDILVNNAALHGEQEITELDDALWQKLITNNLESIYWLSVFVGLKMREAGSGVIVNLSSIAADFPRPANIIYATTKGAIRTLTRGLAVALAPQVRVNAVSPGRIETDMSPMSDEVKRQMVQESNLRKRIGQPEDIAKIVAFLASDESDWINGQTIRVDGGSSVLAKV